MAFARAERRRIAGRIYYAQCLDRAASRRNMRRPVGD